MEDAQIVSLYEARDEAAIAESRKKYGSFCHTLAGNLLSSREDAEECVSDALLRAWNTIPPVKPDSLRAYLGKLVRNLSIDRFRKNHAGKRDSGLTQLLSELSDCLPARQDVEKIVEASLLSETIARFLRTLPKGDQALFVRRYWYGVPLGTLALEQGVSKSKLASRLFRLREKLRAYLAQEGVLL